MAPSVRHVTSDRLQVREGGGGIALFGLPFFAAGIFLGLTALGLVPMSNAHEMPAWGWPALVLMAVAFTGVGGTLVFGRSWTTIDIAQRTVLKQWGLLLPLREQSFRLDDYSGVTLSFVRGDSDSADRFPVGLSARSGADLPLCSFTEYAESRTCAVAIARHARLDVEDATTDHPIRLAPNQADQPFHLAAWTKRISSSSAERPHNARSEVGHDAAGVRIVIPKPRRHALVFALGLIPLAVPLIFAPPLAAFFRSTHTPDPVAWTFLGFLILFFGILPATSALNAYLRSRRGGTIVFVSLPAFAFRTAAHGGPPRWPRSRRPTLSTSTTAPANLQRRRRDRPLNKGPWNQSDWALLNRPRTQWALTALARLLPSRGLTVKTRHGLTSFGEGLDDEEVRYLYSVVLHALRES